MSSNPAGGRATVVFSFVVLAIVGGVLFFAFSDDAGEPQEATAQAVGGPPAAEGVFREEAKGQDAAHWGKGTVKVYRQSDGSLVLEFQDDFKSGPIPAPWIYLNSKANIDDEADFNADRKRIKFSALNSPTGRQSYVIKGRELKNLRAVTIWCEQFGAYIASANLTPAG